MDKIKVALYMRVSTPTNKDKKGYRGQTVENQLPDLDRFWESRGWEVYGTYIDDVSATKKRPQWDLMMKEAFEGRFKAVLVWKLDRFARSIADFTNAVALLDSYGVRFISVTQGIDTDKSNPTGRLLMHIIAVIAEFERALISERVKAGMARKKAAGGRIGRDPVIFDMQKALDMKREGMSWRAIARFLTVKKTTLIERMKEYTSSQVDL